jgi:hypothetical protein
MLVVIRQLRPRLVFEIVLASKQFVANRLWSIDSSELPTSAILESMPHLRLEKNRATSIKFISIQLYPAGAGTKVIRGSSRAARTVELQPHGGAWMPQFERTTSPLKRKS